MNTFSKLDFDWHTRTLSTSNILGEKIRVGRQYQYLYEFPGYYGSDEGRNIVLTVKNGGIQGKRFPTFSLEDLDGVTLPVYENFLGFSGGELTALEKPSFTIEDLSDTDITSYTDTYVITYEIDPVTQIAKWRLRPEAYSLKTLSDVDYRATPSNHKQVLRNVTQAEQSSSSPSAPKGTATTDLFSLEFDINPGLATDVDANRFGIYNYQCRTQFINLNEGEFEATLDIRNYDVFYIRTVNEFVDVSFITGEVTNLLTRYMLIDGASYVHINYPHVELENGYIPRYIGTICSYSLHFLGNVLSVMNKGINYE